MDQRPVTVSVLDLDISFKAGADLERIKVAASYVENMYADQKNKALGSQSKDIILTYLALGLADELLQMKVQQKQMLSSLQSLLAKIEKDT